MIVPRTALHKWRTLPAALALVLATGCGGDEEAPRGSAEQAADPVPASRACAVTVDASGWEAFVALAARIEAGEQVPREEMGGLGAHPVWQRWRPAVDDAIDLRRIGNWIEATFWEELGRTGSQKRHPIREAYVRSWRWSWAHREDVAARAVETAADSCVLADLLERWVAPEHRAGGIRLSILPTRPEFRYREGEVFLDTGFLVAMPRQRLMHEITGLIYRNHEFIPGVDPRATDGAAAVAHTFRRMRNEGTAHWIEDTPNAYFFSDHYTFRNMVVVPEQYWDKAILAMNVLNRQLPPLWEDPELLESRGRDLMVALNTIHSHRNLGWAMATVVAAHLGEERLHEASASVPGFVAAFQEAASRNAVPVPELEEARGRYHEAVPAFTEEAWRGLETMLAEHFPG